MVIKRIRGKNADKSLDLIFTILILVIVATVIIMLVIKFGHQVKSPYPQNATKEFIRNHLYDCYTECSNYKGNNDNNAGLEYCTHVYSLPNSGNYEKKATYGTLTYCTDHITCTLMIDLASKYGIRTTNNANYCKLGYNDCEELIYSEMDKYKTTVMNKYVNLMKDAPYGSCDMDITRSNWMANILSSDLNRAYGIEINRSSVTLNNPPFYDATMLNEIGGALENGGTKDYTNGDNITITTKNIVYSQYAREAMRKYLYDNEYRANNNKSSVYQIKENLTEEANN